MSSVIDSRNRPSRQSTVLFEDSLNGSHDGRVTHDDADLSVTLGDDRTDEELFAALPRSAVAVHIGSGESLANHRLHDPLATRAISGALLARVTGDARSSRQGRPSWKRCRASIAQLELGTAVAHR
jgi:hypothetical protein